MQLLELHQVKKLACRCEAGAFRLIAGESALSDYQFGKRTTHYVFCKHCGVSSFVSGEDKNLGGKFYAVNVTCLDDATVDELINAPITYLDGRHDNYRRRRRRFAIYDSPAA